MFAGVEKYNWEKYWSSNRSLLSCSYWGFYYTQILEKQFGKGFITTLIISKQGHSTCYFDTKDRKNFGEFRIGQMQSNWPNSAHVLAKEIKDKADALMNLTETLIQKNINEPEWQNFVQSFTNYIGYHISPRNIIDFLNPAEQEQVKEIFTEVRLYTEPVWKKTELFVAEFAKQIGSKTNYRSTNILSCFKEEVEEYFATGLLPSETILEERYNQCAIWWKSDRTREIVVGKQISNIENVITKVNTETNIIKGNCAYDGTVTGRVRIVFNPLQVNDFAVGDILVTGMTRPEFLMLMKRASAIVTDAGGILCHAAITAREIKKPTIIGTKNATQILKDGDLVEVDATAGTITKL